MNGAVESGRAQVSYLAADLERYEERPWRAVDSEKECWVSPPGGVGESYERFPSGCAAIWRLNGKVVRTRVDSTSPSGDWVTSDEYTFWGDGWVAFRLLQHRAFSCAVPGADDAAPDACGEDEREYRDERGSLVRTRHERWGMRGKTRAIMPEVSFPPGASELQHAHLADLPFGKQLD